MALHDIKNVMKRYGFKKRGRKNIYLGKIFYQCLDKRIWIKLQNFVTKTEHAKIRHAWEVLSCRFDKFWKCLGAPERRRRISLLKTALKFRKNRKIAKELKILFGPENPTSIEIVVLFTPVTGGTISGGANIGNKSITLEIPKLRRSAFEIDISIGVLFHEVVHIIFDKMGMEKYIRTSVKKHKLPLKLSRELANEIITSTLAPYGYLTNKFYGEKFTKQIFSRSNVKRMGKAYKSYKKGSIKNRSALIKYFAWKLQPIVVDQVNSRGRINQEFVDAVVQEIKK